LLVGGGVDEAEGGVALVDDEEGLGGDGEGEQEQEEGVVLRVGIGGKYSGRRSFAFRKR